MPKAQMIRADTIDLQNHDNPSAADHTRQPASPGSIGDGPPAPHQASALRHASMDESSLLGRSPRASQDLSGKELQLLAEQHSDLDDQDGADIEASLGLQRGEHGGQHDGELDDEDEDMDDDMMDKISSSPSIDDGGYPQSPHAGVEAIASTPSADDFLSADPVLQSSSPFTSTPEHFPLGYSFEDGVGASFGRDHQPVPGEYPNSTDSNEGKSDDEYESVLGQSSPSPSLLSWVPLLGDDGEPFAVTGDIPGAEWTPRSSLGLEVEADDSSVHSTAESYHTLNDNQKTADDHSDDVHADEDQYADARFIDSGWGGECLREPEDIDFEFVYALHTFVATVEGQANATKGDTMVLLDDSNSYWWLVRVVKDSSIGYLPAEHIETPTERLARLNKHRNIDLSQTMLGDNPEKSRNPLKKAMRRRNVKTVQFTDPIYYEPTHNDYSSEEEGEDDMEFLTVADSAQDGDHDQQDQHQQQAQHQQRDQQIKERHHVENTVQPLRVRGQEARDEGSDDVNGTKSDQPYAPADPRIDRPRMSEESMDSEDGQRGSRRMRNTDSFYKEDPIRKISLTPHLLKDDQASQGSSTMVESRESRDISMRSSTESGEKPPPVVVTAEKPSKEKKEKKPSKFSGLFKRRDRKSKQQNEEETDDFLNKRESQPGSGTSPQPPLGHESMEGPTSPRLSQQVRTSKLQKHPPSKGGSLRRESSREDASARSSTADQYGNERQRADIPATVDEDPNPFADRAGPQRTPETSNNNSRNNSRRASPTGDGPRTGFGFRGPRPAQQEPQEAEPRPERVKQAKARMALDESDESDDGIHTYPAAPTRRAPEPQQAQVHAPEKDRLSESPVQVVSPLETRNKGGPGAPGLVADDASHSSRGGRISPVSPSESPELIEHPGAINEPGERGIRGPAATTAAAAAAAAAVDHSERPITPPARHPNHSASTTPASQSTQTSRSAPQWSDQHLRNYMETSMDDIRDLLVVVGDTSGVKAPSSEHPTVKSFDGERKRLKDMDDRLDDMLKGLMARRGVGNKVHGKAGVGS